MSVMAMAFTDPKHEVRSVALHHTQDAWPKLVEKVAPRVAANSRTKIVETPRSGLSPIRTVTVWIATEASTPRK